MEWSSRAATIQASQPAGRKIVAQCVSTGRATVPPQPRNGAKEPLRRSLFRPVPGLANAARLLPTALRRGLLSFALRALRADYLPLRLRTFPRSWYQFRATLGTGGVMSSGGARI